MTFYLAIGIPAFIMFIAVLCESFGLAEALGDGE